MHPDAPAEPPRTWIVTDGASGNLRQAAALATALGVQAEEWVVRPASPWGWLAPHLRFAAGRALPQSLREAVASRPPALVIGCGRQAALATAWLRADCGAFVVQLLDPRANPRHWDLVVAPAHDRLHGANVIATSGSLHAITPAVLAEAAILHADLARIGGPRTAVLIGGPTRAQRIDARYVDRLFDLLECWHAHDRGGMLVTTSRRTPETLVRRVRERCADLPARLWSSTDDGPNPYLGILAHAQRIVVTPDSSNMLSEACATGKPVYVFAPRPIRGKLGDLHHELVVDGRVRPLREVPTDWTPPAPVREASAVAAQVWQRYRQARGCG
jgi:mitochondrial fission protein ELM1